MNTGITYKKLKRRFKKKLYNFLVVLNNVDFGKFRPICYLFLIIGILLALTKLPTPETTGTDSLQATLGSELAAAIRSGTSAQNSTPADVIALFLPNATTTENITASLSGETLYSFYLTGAELSYLAEGAITSNSKDNFIYLDGLNYTYHKNRLPFNRVTELCTASGTEIIVNQLYQVISTEDIFSLFHYISYRSIGIMSIFPKDANGAVLSDYQKVVVTETGAPFTVHHALTYSENTRALITSTPSLVTIQHGFNLIDLVKEPNKITICFCALLIALLALLWYMVPRMNRIRLWFRIYRIHSKKRSTHTYFYGLRKRP